MERETNAQKLLRTLREASGPLCDDCATRTGNFGSRQIVFQEAERLTSRSEIQREKNIRCSMCGQHKKCSWLPGDQLDNETALPEVRFKMSSSFDGLTARGFEDLARSRMSEEFGARLVAMAVGRVPKVFDLVSSDGTIVGDAKYYSLVNGTGMPPAKFSTIAEHVWLLEKTDATRRFLVFGNDIRVPRMWLARYGSLVHNVTFYFLRADGALETLNDQG